MLLIKRTTTDESVYKKTGIRSMYVSEVNRERETGKIYWINCHPDIGQATRFSTVSEAQEVCDYLSGNIRFVEEIVEID